ncbi:MAG: hypothetical protein JO149_08950 [Gammaproteobacteria bacterium]|nr:hypothetical protein [Gammaproteobacteria bacterium]
MRAYLALMLSFGVYFFPIPAAQDPLLSNWAGVVFSLLRNAADLNMAAYLVLILAILYQLLCAYCIYKFLDLNLLGMLIFCFPLLSLMYVVLLFVIYGPQSFHLLMNEGRHLISHGFARYLG